MITTKTNNVKKNVHICKKLVFHFSWLDDKSVEQFIKGYHMGFFSMFCSSWLYLINAWWPCLPSTIFLSFIVINVRCLYSVRTFWYLKHIVIWSIGVIVLAVHFRWKNALVLSLNWLFLEIVKICKQLWPWTWKPWTVLIINISRCSWICERH